jgi:hypothetical protein
MSYYIVNVGTGRAWGKAYWQKQEYTTERGAKGACTRLNRSYTGTELSVADKKDVVQWKVMSRAEYDARPVKMVERVNLMSGLKYMEAEGTPGFMSPASEAYWSM